MNIISNLNIINLFNITLYYLLWATQSQAFDNRYLLIISFFLSIINLKKSYLIYIIIFNIIFLFISFVQILFIDINNFNFNNGIIALLASNLILVICLCSYNFIFHNFRLILYFSIFILFISLFTSDFTTYNYDFDTVDYCRINTLQISESFLYTEHSHYALSFIGFIMMSMYYFSQHINLKNGLIFLFLVINSFFYFSFTLTASLIFSVIFSILFFYKKLNLTFYIFSFITLILFSSFLFVHSSNCMNRVTDTYTYNSITSNLEIIDSLTNKLELNNIEMTLLDKKLNDYNQLISTNKNLEFKDLDTINKNLELKDLDTIDLIEYLTKELDINDEEIIEDYINRRIIIDDLYQNKKPNVSTSVVLFNLAIMKKSFLDYPLGVGVNNYEFANRRYSEETTKVYPVLVNLNYNDGSSNFIKIITEFGIFSFIVFFFVFYHLFKQSNYIFLPIKLFLISTILASMIRGAGYFNAGFLLSSILLIILFYYEKNANHQK